ncbi:MAG: hypothetical protein NVV59_12060 [Chitinophagaceae bacterium]|nr:hypothetical protein [Chitinophagaceae bacterium]
MEEKDMEVYGNKGYVFCLDNDKMLLMENDRRSSDTLRAAPNDTSYSDPFVYFKDVIRGNIKPAPFDLSSADNNFIVVQILEAAKKSASTGKTVFLDR